MKQPWLDQLPAARAEHAAELERLLAQLTRLAPAAQRRLVVATVRCPQRGCELGRIYEMAILGGGARYVFRGKTPSGKPKDGLMNWAWRDDAYAPVFYSVGCKHGLAKLEIGWLLELPAAVFVWKHALETEEQFLANLPAEMSAGRNSRVFHPPAEAWA